MRCTNGHSLRRGQKFCSICGTGLQNPYADSDPIVIGNGKPDNYVSCECRVGFTAPGEEELIKSKGIFFCPYSGHKYLIPVYDGH